MIFKHCADDATESEIKTDCNTVIPMVTKCLCKRQHFLGHIPTALFPVPVILLGHQEKLPKILPQSEGLRYIIILKNEVELDEKIPFIYMQFLTLPSFSPPALHTCF